ncbi:MAG: ABC transporter substrate-binding protein [Lachnospiraceae bacterium]|jgi:branched-chain amino acid transport system substrate-binding protein|nr:ABC transporter substrate-binding protein [Lachnospiraceae bacterium]
MRKRILALGLSAVLAISMLAGCGGNGGGSKADSNVIKIGVFEPQTGENGGGGLQEVDGIRYANKQKNTVKIGDKEYKIELVEVDNKSDKTEAVTAAQKLVDEKVIGVLGSYGSGVSIAAGEIFSKAKIPAIGCSCTNPQVTEGNDYYFRVCFLDPFQGTVMANYAKEVGCTKAAILTQKGDDYSVGLGTFFKNAFEKLGCEVVANEQYETGAQDFKATLTNIKSKNPDVIFAPSSIATAPLIIKQARELGITAKIMAGDTWENGEIIKNAGKDAEGVCLSTFFDEDGVDADGKSFIEGFKAYLKENKKDEVIPAVSALGYDAYNALVAAIEKAGSTDPSKVQEALKSVSVKGVTGDISFDNNGDAKKDMAFIKTVEGGAFKFLKTQKAQ